jgi:hypothetical protein
VINVERDPHVSLAVDGTSARPYVAQGRALLRPIAEHPDLVAGLAAKYDGWDATDESQDGPGVLLEIRVDRWLLTGG